MAGGLFIVDDEESAPSSRMTDSTQIRTRTKSRTPFMVAIKSDYVLRESLFLEMRQAIITF